jgi:RHS repeat-associated protein
LARTELGENQIQGLDYVYTLQGWIKGVNSNTLDTTRDIGHDGNRVTGNPNAYFAKDVFGYTLNYFAGDYTAINGTVSQTANNFESEKTNSDLLVNREDFFNGNISAMVTTITNPTTGEVLPQGMAYSYDQLNRLLSAKAFTNLDAVTNTWQSGSVYNNSYFNEFTYDANGNILTQKRHDQSGNAIEDLTYQYARNTGGEIIQNRLYHVNDNVSANIATDDIDDQGVFTQTNINNSNNYAYDGEGRLIRDDQEEIASIEWTVTGKVKSVTRVANSTKKNLKFRYDAMGMRVAKEIYDSQNNWEKTTFYVRDPQGNVMGIYEKKVDAQTQQLSYKVTERYIYGSSTVGLVTIESELISANSSSTTTFVHVVGEKQLYAQNHLGNLLSTISDKIISYDWDNDLIVDYYGAEILSSTDFTGFGVKLDGRNFVVKKPRVDFNGKETDEETEWQDYGMRIYEPRLGRFVSVDPLEKIYPQLSPFQFASNMPVMAVDLEGLEASEVVTNTYDSDGNLIKTVHAITLIVTVYNTSTVPLTNEQLLEKVKPIESQTEGSLSTKSTNANGVTTEYSVDVQFVVAENPTIAPASTVDATGNTKTDATGFSLVLVDNVTDPFSGTPAAQGTLGVTDNIGNTQVNRVQVDIDLSPEEFKRTGAHEICHALGLRHPNDETNPESRDQTKGNNLSIKTDPLNLMRQSLKTGALSINNAQRDIISQNIKAQGKSVLKTVGLGQTFMKKLESPQKK